MIFSFNKNILLWRNDDVICLFLLALDSLSVFLSTAPIVRQQCELACPHPTPSTLPFLSFLEPFCLSFLSFCFVFVHFSLLLLWLCNLFSLLFCSFSQVSWEVHFDVPKHEKWQTALIQLGLFSYITLKLKPLDQKFMTKTLIWFI